MDQLNLVDASIDEIQQALASGAVTCVELVARYLRRISRYDCQGLALNSIPILNQQMFEEAALSDDRRAMGLPARSLEGIPFTVKDSYKVQGMTVASGSPAFKDLIANEDAFTVQRIRSEGGILIGRTNMPPMAYGGMQRGVYGRAESPYNPDYLAAAWSSGSSNGSAVSTAASFAAFGMGEETVSSGRSPASNNSLVAYTPSRGWISIRGNWPLYPTCDVVVPHTRTMGDMLKVLEVVTTEDELKNGDFWREQPFVKLERPWEGKPRRTIFQNIGTSTSLRGLRIAVPNMYTGGVAPDGSIPVYTSDGVRDLWIKAKAKLRDLGAAIVEVHDFPVVTAYENPVLLPAGAVRLPEDWVWYERGPLVAHGWERFLRANEDSKIKGLEDVDEHEIWPANMRTEAEMVHFPASNSIHWGKLAGYVRGTDIYETKNLKAALVALEGLRKDLMDQFLDQVGCDCVAFPAQGDVGREDSDVNHESAAHAWKNGVFYSNGNRALRHLGIPSITIPMGIMENNDMPVGLTLAGRAYDDENLLRWASAFEKSSRVRRAPKYTPSLPSDLICLNEGTGPTVRTKRPLLEVSSHLKQTAESGFILIEVKGSIETDLKEPILEISVNGNDISRETVKLDLVSTSNESTTSWSFEACTQVAKPLPRAGRERTMVPVARDTIIVVVVAKRTETGYATGSLELMNIEAVDQ